VAAAVSTFVTPRAVDTVIAESRPRRRRRPGGAWWAWLVVIIGAGYFIVPLIATFEFSIRPNPPTRAYAIVLQDERFFSGLAYSFVAGLITIVLSLALIVPTAYWVRLRLPRLRPVVEFITLLPFVLPPIVLAYGLIRFYSRQPLVLTGTEQGSDLLLIAAYVVLSLPYMYRAVDNGLAAMDVRVLTEAAQSLGAGWFRILWSVIFPNLRTAALSGAFLTLAIVIGEFTIASALAREAFAPYLSLLGRDKIYEPAAVALISFGLTWMAMILLALVARGSRTRVQMGGAR
jgi:putative spermidine/putrescine transport system permease protein